MQDRYGSPCGNQGRKRLGSSTSPTGSSAGPCATPESQPGESPRDERANARDARCESASKRVRDALVNAARDACRESAGAWKV